MRFARCIVWWVLLLLLVPVAYARLSGQDLKQAKEMVKGTLYLRIDAPIRWWRSGGFRQYPAADALLQVSPTEFNVERKLSFPPARREVYWGASPNDAVRYGKIRLWGGDALQVWMEGVPPKDDEVFIDFINIKTLDDFKKAFDLTFSRVPLQDEHPEWPEEIRRAIAERRVIAGMTKQQAFCVVGMPIKTEMGEENGVTVERWFPRNDRGTYARRESTRTGCPAIIQVVDGKVSAIEDTARSPDLKP